MLLKRCAFRLRLGLRRRFLLDRQNRRFLLLLDWRICGFRCFRCGRSALRQRDFARFLPCQLRKRAAGRGHDEQQSQNDAQYACFLIFRQEQNSLFHRRSSQTQRRRFARRLRQNRAGVVKTLALRQLGGDCLVTRQLRVALRANRSKPDERIPPVDNHRRHPAERPEKIQMAQMREFMAQNKLRLVRLQHVLRQIDRRKQTGKARRFDRVGNIDARSAALTKKNAGRGAAES